MILIRLLVQDHDGRGTGKTRVMVTFEVDGFDGFRVADWAFVSVHY